MEAWQTTLFFNCGAVDRLGDIHFTKQRNNRSTGKKNIKVHQVHQVQLTTSTEISPLSPHIVLPRSSYSSTRGSIRTRHIRSRGRCPPRHRGNRIPLLSRRRRSVTSWRLNVIPLTGIHIAYLQWTGSRCWIALLGLRRSPGCEGFRGEGTCEVWVREMEDVVCVFGKGGYEGFRGDVMCDDEILECCDDVVCYI